MLYFQQPFPWRYAKMAEHRDIIIVGAGISGLTAATSLAMRGGHSVLLLEKGNVPGGLVNSFTREGFLFDGGVRALENAGMLKPMLQELEIDLPLLPSNVSLGLRIRSSMQIPRVAWRHIGIFFWSSILRAGMM